MSTNHTENCNSITNIIREWCIENVRTTAAHIPGIENVQADHASGYSQTGMEWKLNQHMPMHRLRLLQYSPAIDVFTSSIMYHIGQTQAV